MTPPGFSVFLSTPASFMAARSRGTHVRQVVHENRIIFGYVID
jgi:hypothetical protein